jgi:putative transposase
LGLLLAIVVHAADVQDREGAKRVLVLLLGRFPRLALFWADAGYAGTLLDWAKALAGWTMQIVTKLPEQHSFVVLARRWVVERTFAWLGKYRRLSKDYEENPRSSEAWIRLAMIHLMVRRLAPA